MTSGASALGSCHDDAEPSADADEKLLLSLRKRCSYCVVRLRPMSRLPARTWKSAPALPEVSCSESAGVSEELSWTCPWNCTPPTLTLAGANAADCAGAATLPNASVPGAGEMAGAAMGWYAAVRSALDGIGVTVSSRGCAGGAKRTPRAIPASNASDKTDSLTETRPGVASRPASGVTVTPDTN